MKKFFSSLLLLGSSLFFVACEDSGDSSSVSRPRTLDTLILTTPFGDTFEFVRSFSSDSAENNGDIERGAFFYTSGGTNLQTYPALNGDNSDVQFPDSVNLATYEYLAVNDTSGVITLTGQGVNDLNITGNFDAANASFTFFFNSDSAGLVSNQVTIDATFEASLTTITDVTTTFAITNATDPDIDTVVIDTSLTTNSGGSVARGFNPDLDLDRASALVPATFTGLIFDFVDDDGIEPEVRLQFTADTVVNSSVLNVDETGQALLRVNGGVILGGVNYMAERTLQTSDVELILDGGNNDQDGTYILQFEALDSGVVTQTNGAGSLLVGRFQVFDDGNL